jgi:aquaporin Z
MIERVREHRPQEGTPMTTAPDPYLSPPSAPPGTAVEPHRLGEAGVVEAPRVGLLTRVGAELFGTFALVLVILGTALYLQLTAVGALGVALATALVLAGLVAAFGHVSGGHFNPAVSLGAALAGRIGFLDMLAYWVAQVVGALLAALVLFVSVPSGLAAALTGNSTAGAQDLFATVSNGWGEQSPLFAQTEPYTTQAGLPTITFDLKTALLLEAIGTAIFVAVILGVTGRKAAAQTAPFAIGGTLGAMILVTGLATNAGLNPARSTATALLAGGESLGQLWLFWVAPLVGAAIVGLVVMAFAPAPEVPYDPDGELDEPDDEDDEVVEDEIEVTDQDDARS